MGIRLVHTETLRLTEFMDRNIPRYAVLSHTWEYGQEISFQEMTAIGADPDHPAAKKPGYAKVVETCQQARRNNIAYAWVDTCCIDKTSSSELSEAINSMYRWYQQAEVCYVLLTDFDVASVSLRAALPKCRWWTRGWCLQELVAPPREEFFDARWHHVGSKTDLAPLITEITGIDEEVLIDNSLIDSLPVARRMSWAAGRETSREEDMAYCLLGIFNVSMPMLYGEGKKAFLRLQEQIIQTSNDLSIFAFLHGTSTDGLGSGCIPLQPYCDLFAAYPSDFMGCRDLVHTRMDVHWNNAFTLTNKGIHFRRAELEVDLRHGLYCMLLNCRFSDSEPAKMYLRKVGPRLYARYDDRHPMETTSQVNANHYEDPYIITEEEIYILPRVSCSIKRHLEHEGDHTIYVHSLTHSLSRALQVVQRSTSSDRWDAARMQFLAKGEESFGGYWKVFPSLARRIDDDNEAGEESSSYTMPSGHFYMLCGFDRSVGDVSEVRAWVRLYSAEEWRGLEKKLGIMTNLNDVVRLTGGARAQDQIILGSGSSTLKVIATIKLDIRERSRHRLELDFQNGRDKEIS
ncbi:hypothetical protein DL770_005876 [Monosporascus sp. CRB-9-2]|nr:hypothetical protein DL770_005876 [Monosporascus sp. CRB-9-2]